MVITLRRRGLPARDVPKESVYVAEHRVGEEESFALREAGGGDGQHHTTRQQI